MIVFAVLTVRVIATPAYATTLPDATTANAASKCQHGILQAGSKFVTAKLGNLQSCTNGILKCIETKIGDKKCLAAASRKCTGNLAKILTSEVSFSNAIKNACKSVSSTDLAAEVGLAYGRDHDTCLEDFGADVGTRDGVVTCIVRQHARTAEELFSVQQARTIKLLDAAGVARTTLCDVPANPDCDDCETSNPPDAGKRIVACAAAVAKAGTAFVKTTIAAITKCTKASFACAVTPSTPEKTDACNAKATTACTSAFAGFAAARDKADVAIETNKSCGAVPFSLLVQKSALNLDALAADCTTAQSGKLPSIEAYAKCVHQRHECDVKALAPFAAPRLDDLLGGVGVPDPLCPNAGAGVAARSLAVPDIAGPLLAAADGVSTGNIGDIIGAITRPGPGGSTGQREGGFKAPTSGATNAVNGASSSTFTFAPGRPKPVKIAYTRCGDDTTTPRLIVAAKDEHGDFVADHFALDLPKPSDDSTDTDVEVTFQASVRSCVRLAFATECGSGPNAFVSNYVRLPQVPEVVANETETPTPTSIATPSGTATATIAAATVTPSSTPSASPTPSRTATASAATGTPSPTPTATLAPTVTPTPGGSGADLMPTALGPATAVAGQTATLTWTVKNQGTASAPASTWSDVVYLSTNNTFDAGDTQLTSLTNPSALAPGASYTTSVSAGIPTVTPGSYFLIVRVDSGNNVGETDETNNVRVTPITITAPDLTPTALAASTAVAGQPLTITWTVANQGNGDAPSGTSSDTVYLSTDGALDLSDVALASIANPIAVAPGASYTSSAAPTMPQLAAGSYFLILRVDSGNSVFESVESNNITVIPVTITAPDVVPTALTASPAVAGQPVTLNWTVANQGTGVAPVGAWFDTVYLSTDNVLDLGDVPLASPGNPLGLAAGGTYTQAAKIYFPNVASGSYFLILRVDSGNSLFESNEGNNLRVTPITVTAPDLVPTALTTSPPIAGRPVTFTWTVANQGNGGVPANTSSDYVYLSTDDVLDINDVLLTSGSDPISVAAGASYTLNVDAGFPAVAPGDYFLILRVDQANSVFESNEGNNLRVVPITVTAPDLAPTALTASAAVVGQPLTFNWTAVNQGTGAAPAGVWVDTVYLSTDNVFDGNDVALASVGNPTAVAPGATYMVTAGGSIPNVTPGSYFLILRVNSAGNLFESNTGNNARVIAITVNASPTPTATPTGGATPTPTSTPLPDLVATALGPSAAVAGQAFTATWTVANQGVGVAPANAWVDNIYLSTDNVFDVGDTHVAGQLTPTALAAGGSYSQNFSGAIPNVPPGNYFLILRADDGGNLVESNEGNNTRVSPITITAPDLAPTALALGGPAVAGQAVTAIFTVANQGTGSAPSSGWYDQVYLSNDDTLDAGDTLLNSGGNPRGLVPGASYTQYLSIGIPNVASGSYFLILRTDGNGNVFESNEANNLIVEPITITAVDLTSTALTLTAPAVAGQAVTVSWTVANQGTGNAPGGAWSDNLYLSTNNVFDVNDVQLTSNGNPRALAPGESYTQNVGVNIPNVAPGSYFLILRVDGNANLVESNEANNVRVTPITITAVDLAPTALAPSTGVAGQAFPLSWTVTNQGTGTAPAGMWTDNVYLSTDDVFDFSDMQLTSNVNPAKLEPGSSYTQYAPTTIPNVPPGDYFLILRVDSGSVVFESNEGNNARVTPITITAPDLAPTALGPATAAAGQPTTVSWSVTNQGNGAAANSWSDFVYLSTDNVLDFSDVLLTTAVNPTGLLPGASYTTGMAITMPNVPPGGYFLILRVDFSSVVIESSEANNGRVTPITIN